MRHVEHTYAVALGSNRRSRHGSPARTLEAAAEMLDADLLSRIHLTPAHGPAGRSFANAAMLLWTSLTPPELLAELKRIEVAFGRRAGRRWGARVLDLDIILWSGGAWSDARLTIPHPAFRQRLFVLAPLAEVAPGWRDPLGGRSVRQLLARARRRRPVDPCPTRA